MKSNSRHSDSSKTTKTIRKQRDSTAEEKQPPHVSLLRVLKQNSPTKPFEGINMLSIPNAKHLHKFENKYDFTHLIYCGVHRSSLRENVWSWMKTTCWVQTHACQGHPQGIMGNQQLLLYSMDPKCSCLFISHKCYSCQIHKPVHECLKFKSSL